MTTPSSNLVKELQEELLSLKKKGQQGIKHDVEDMEVLLLASLMEEEENERRSIKRKSSLS